MAKGDQSLTEGQMSDGLAATQGQGTAGRQGYDSDWFHNALVSRGTTPCISPTANRKVQHACDKQLYPQRHKIENLFARLKDWRRIATRYDRCAHTFMSAIACKGRIWITSGHCIICCMYTEGIAQEYNPRPAPEPYPAISANE